MCEKNSNFARENVQKHKNAYDGNMKHLGYLPK